MVTFPSEMFPREVGCLEVFHEKTGEGWSAGSIYLFFGGGAFCWLIHGFSGYQWWGHSFVLERRGIRSIHPSIHTPGALFKFVCVCVCALLFWGFPLSAAGLFYTG